MDETNTAAGRGAPGVSDVAASATWTLDTLFHAACPQPPDQPGANADCHLGATGVNVHNAEVRAYFFPQEGNAYYNAIRYDPTAAMGTPTPAPSYYALLLFARLAQGTTGCAPRRRARSGPGRCETAPERRVFVINRPAAATIELPAPQDRRDRPDDALRPGGGRSTRPTCGSTAGRSRPTGRSPASSRPHATPAAGGSTSAWGPERRRSSGSLNVGVADRPGRDATSQARSAPAPGPPRPDR